MEKYQIQKTLGDGSFGTVYKAVNTETGEIVAIKKMKKKFNNWEECRNLREVKSLIKLNHPNIMLLKEVLKVKDELYLVFEYLIENLYQTYGNLKEKGKTFSEDQIKSLVYQMASALAYMHKHGFFHRDLKPENILVHRDKAKLADFGLAREIRSRPPYTDHVSTRWYRAPELLLKSTNYNSPVDVFALGCIMAELYMSHPLFMGNSELDQMYKVCSVLGTPSKESWPDGYRLASKIGFNFPQFNPVNLASIIPNASPEAINLISEMLKFDPQKRITAQQIIQHPYFHGFSPEGILINDAEPLPIAKKDINNNTNNTASTTETQREKPVQVKPTLLQHTRSISPVKEEKKNDFISAPLDTEGNVDLDFLEKNLLESPPKTFTQTTNLNSNPTTNVNSNTTTTDYLSFDTSSALGNIGGTSSLGSNTLQSNTGLIGSYSTNQLGTQNGLYRGTTNSNLLNNNNTNQYSNNAGYGLYRANNNNRRGIQSGMIDIGSTDTRPTYGASTYNLSSMNQDGIDPMSKAFNAMSLDNKRDSYEPGKNFFGNQRTKSPIKTNLYGENQFSKISSTSNLGLTSGLAGSPLRYSPKNKNVQSNIFNAKKQDDDALTELLTKGFGNKGMTSARNESPIRQPYSNYTNSYGTNNYGISKMNLGTNQLSSNPTYFGTGGGYPTSVDEGYYGRYKI